MIAIGQRGIGVIAALVVVVFHVEAAQFRVLDAERAARVVNVLTVQRLDGNKKKKKGIHYVIVSCMYVWQPFPATHQFGRLGSDNIRILDQGLECI